MLAIVTLVATTAACRRAAVAPAPIPAPRFERRVVELENGLIALQIVIPFGSSEPKPTVIGLGDMTDELVEAGIVSLTYRIDWSTRQGAPLPMTPFPPGTGTWFLASPSAGRIGERWTRSIASVADIAIPRIVDYLQTLPAVDPERIVVAGTSTDGFVALQALARDERLAGAIAIGACGDYQGFLRDSPLGLAGTPVMLEPSYESWLIAQEIVYRADRIAPVPLLLVNRVADPVVPIACADATARALEPFYESTGDTDRFRHVRIPGVAHGLAAEERTEIKRFLARFFLR